MTSKVLVVDDDKDIADALDQALTRNGFGVTVCRTGEDGFFQALTESFDMVLLDLVLPGRSGLEILTALRKQNSKVPIIMLSTRNDVEDRVHGLAMQADDYVGKPFALNELLARVHSLLRRSNISRPAELCIGDLHLHPITRLVMRGNKTLNLTLREFEILFYFMQKPGEIVTRTMLAQDVWQDVKRATPLDNVIDVHVSRLRRKIEINGHKELLHTVRGIGFCISDRSIPPESEHSVIPVPILKNIKIPFIADSMHECIIF